MLLLMQKCLHLWLIALTCHSNGTTEEITVIRDDTCATADAAVMLMLLVDVIVEVFDKQASAAPLRTCSASHHTIQQNHNATPSHCPEALTQITDSISWHLHKAEDYIKLTFWLLVKITRIYLWKEENGVVRWWHALFFPLSKAGFTANFACVFLSRQIPSPASLEVSVWTWCM